MENQSPSQRPSSDKEWKLIEKLLGQAQEEHRKSRRWGIFFKALTFVYLFALLSMMVAGRTSSTGLSAVEDHVAVVVVNGVIAPDQDASADLIVTGLARAFEAENSKAVLLKINSPGGSPVQSNQVYNAIKRLRAEHPDKKLYAAITDVGASGAYYIASAADEIYADPASIVGSIGVIMAGFGLEEAADKLGVERRVLTAGSNKAIMDPFSPVRPSDREHMKAMLNEIHQQFITAVRNGRGERLKEAENPEIFTGLFWTGERAETMGLVDGLKSPGDVARDVVGIEDMVNYSVGRSPFEEFVRRFGVSIGEGVASQIGLDGMVPSIR